MQKRLFQRVLIITVLALTLTGCASIPTRASSCMQMLTNTFPTAQNRIPRREQRALLVFDAATNGGIAPAASGLWPCKSVPPPCLWYGVTCASGHITELDLKYQNLGGKIPAELGNLSQLQGLVLLDTQLTGEIPPELGDLSQLRVLNLNNNQLSGEIPPELGNLTQIKFLRLQNNQLSGEIPSELGNLPELTGLFLGGNQLTGEIPAELGDLSQLQWLNLENNQLSGPLPDEMTELSLQGLYLSDTDLCVPQIAEFEVWMAGIENNDFDQVPYCE